MDEQLQWLQFQPISPASTSSCGVSLSLTEVILGFDRVTGGRSSISAGPKWIGLVPWQRLARSDMKHLQLMWNRWQVQLQLATTKILIVVIEMWDKKVASNSDIKWAQNWAASHVLSSSWEDLVLQQPLTGRLGEQVLLETFYLFLEETANLYNDHHLHFNYNRYHQEAATMRSRQEEMVKFAASLWEVS